MGKLAAVRAIFSRPEVQATVLTVLVGWGTAKMVALTRASHTELRSLDAQIAWRQQRIEYLREQLGDLGPAPTSPASPVAEDLDPLHAGEAAPTPA